MSLGISNPPLVNLGAPILLYAARVFDEIDFMPEIKTQYIFSGWSGLTPVYITFHLPAISCLVCLCNWRFCILASRADLVAFFERVIVKIEQESRALGGNLLHS